MLSADELLPRRKKEKEGGEGRKGQIDMQPQALTRQEIRDATVTQIFQPDTHRSRSNCSGSCASDPSGNPLDICTSPRRAVLCRRSPEPPGSGRPYGKKHVARKRRSPTSAAHSSPASLARRFCNEKFATRCLAVI